MNSLHSELLEVWCKQNGYQVAWGNSSIISKVKNDLIEKNNTGEIDSVFFDNALKDMINTDYDISNDFPTVIILAIPKEAHILTFQYNQNELLAILPPTYLSYRATFDLVLTQLKVLLKDYELKLVSAPLKIIAAQLGLVKYGRNNLTYVTGMGSYHQLVGVLISKKIDEKDSCKNNLISIMPECCSCNICQKKCPTGALSKDRFLLHQERCLTFINENPDPWPKWLPPSVHHCLIGCLRCQEYCPVNESLLYSKKLIPIFSETETMMILEGYLKDSNDQERKKVYNKLESLGIATYSFSVLSRNLKALIHNKLNEVIK